MSKKRNGRKRTKQKVKEKIKNERKLVFETIAHFKPDLPDPTEVCHWDFEDFRDFVTKTFRAVVPFGGNAWGKFIGDVREWIFGLEWDVNLPREDLMNLAPPFIKTFLTIYAYRSFEHFVSSIRILFGVTDELSENGKINAAEGTLLATMELAAKWRQIKVDSMILLAMKQGMGCYEENDALEATSDDWRYCKYLNDFGELPAKILFYIDRDLMLKFESNLCVFHGHNAQIVYRRLVAYRLRQFIVERITHENRYKRLVKQRVELATYFARSRKRNAKRINKYHQRFGDLAEEMGGGFDFLLTTSNDDGERLRQIHE